MKKRNKAKIMMRRLLFVLFGMVCCLQMEAQPTRSRVQSNRTTGKSEKAAGTTRAFPAAMEMPEDVVWRRDIYRQLDLTLDKNAPLYYPVEPSAGQINLFTYLFDLLLSGKITAYEYKLDGNESFSSRDKVDIKQLMERYHIFYEEKNGKLQVSASDIPSAEVVRYYLKESSYFDQRTSTFHTKVTALCPVLVRGDDFGGEATSYPLFWLKYDDISSYLARHTMMASNYNNVTGMTASDYFSMNCYEGKIYKTNNLQGKVLATYCKTDSAMVHEQKRIEKQLSDFENHIWGHTDSIAADSVKTDSVTTVAAPKAKSSRASRAQSGNSRRSSTASASKKKTTSASKSSSRSGRSASSSSAPRVSVRRERR